MRYKNIFLFIFFLTSFSLHAGQIEELRKKYKAAASNSKEAQELYQQLSAKKIENPVVKAYLGAAQALMARDAKPLHKKMDFIKRSSRSFEQAIQQDKDNVEIRFLRFSINQNLPRALQDKQKMEDDKVAMIKNLPFSAKYGVEKDFKKEIIDFLLSSGRCTNEEIQKLKAM